MLLSLSKLRNKIPLETKKLLVQALVFPFVSYCLPVWGGCVKTQGNRVQKAINFGARIVSGVKRREHITPVLEALCWLGFDEMVQERDALVKRLLSSDPPPALASSLSKRSEISNRTTRSTVMLELPRVRTEHARRSFPFRTVSAWNGGLK